MVHSFWKGGPNVVDYIMAVAARLTWLSVISIVNVCAIIFFIIFWEYIPHMSLCGWAVWGVTVGTGLLMLMVPVPEGAVLEEIHIFSFVALVAGLMVMQISCNELTTTQWEMQNRYTLLYKRGLKTMYLALIIQILGAGYNIYCFWAYTEMWRRILYAH